MTPKHCLHENLEFKALQQTRVGGASGGRCGLRVVLPSRPMLSNRPAGQLMEMEEPVGLGEGKVVRKGEAPNRHPSVRESLGPHGQSLPRWETEEGRSLLDGPQSVLEVSPWPSDK